MFWIIYTVSIKYNSLKPLKARLNSPSFGSFGSGRLCHWQSFAQDQIVFIIVMLPVVSIIVATYNAAETLEDCIKSIIRQKFKHYEIVIIDGKSTDGTLDIIKKYSVQIGYWVSENDNGIYDAMNKGIIASKGEWLIFMGADDVFYDENVLQRFFENAIPNNIGFLYGEVMLKSKNKVSGGSRNYHQIVEKNIPHQAIFYRRDIFEKHGLYNTNYKILADYDINLRIFRDAGIEKKYIPVTVSLFNDKGVSSTIIDKNFFRDQLHYFLHSGEFSRKSAALQKYFFFHGFSLVLQKKWMAGLKDIIHSLLNGHRRFYYFLVMGKFFLSMAGIGKKIKVR